MQDAPTLAITDRGAVYVPSSERFQLSITYNVTSEYAARYGNGKPTGAAMAEFVVAKFPREQCAVIGSALNILREGGRLSSHPVTIPNLDVAISAGLPPSLLTEKQS